LLVDGNGVEDVSELDEVDEDFKYVILSEIL